MTTLEFEAVQVGSDITEGVVTTGAATAFGEEPMHYLSLQVPESASSLKEVYVEVDDQTNGRHDNIVCSILNGLEWVVDLRHPLHTDLDTSRVVVRLSESLAEKLRVGLTTVASVAPSLVGTDT